VTRILLILAALIALSLMVRRALQGASRDESTGRSRPPGRRRGPPGRRESKSPHLPPDTLVCGVCGQAFDPDKTGWICPKCGK
jgi:rubrerythrin